LFLNVDFLGKTLMRQYLVFFG